MSGLLSELISRVEAAVGCAVQDMTLVEVAARGCFSGYERGAAEILCDRGRGVAENVDVHSIRMRLPILILRSTSQSISLVDSITVYRNNEYFLSFQAVLSTYPNSSDSALIHGHYLDYFRTFLAHSTSLYDHSYVAYSLGVSMLLF